MLNVLFGLRQFLNKDGGKTVAENTRPAEAGRPNDEASQ